MMDERALFERFHAALDIAPRSDAYERLREKLTRARPERRPWFSIALPRSGRRLIAAALVVMVAAAAVPAFLALHRYAQQVVTNRKHPGSTAPICVQGLHMVSEKVGWQFAGSRTTDGGLTWRQVAPPDLPNFTKGGSFGCTLDANHAWITETTGPSITQATQLWVLATADGGQTWQKGTPVPAGGGGIIAELGFIDGQRGWLLTDTGSDATPPLTRTIYASSDGGLHWSRVASFSPTGGSSLGKVARGCAETGISFVSTDIGWLTWDCSRSNGPAPAETQTGGPVVAATYDGGRTWAPARLPSYTVAGDSTCGANPPVFSGGEGVISVTCSSVGHGGWAGVYSTTNWGKSWSLGRLPFWVPLSQIDFVDGTTGFLFSVVRTGVNGGANGVNLYRTTNAGGDWVLVKKDVFLGQGVGAFAFINARIGYATSATQGAWMKTTDGGLTWSRPGSSTAVPQNLTCALPPNPRAGGPVPVKMVSPTTGWASGGLRTTDSGSNWSDVAPASLPSRSSGYAEFFLDANHAWMAQAAGSPTACTDHIVTFATADGGQSWREAAPIPVTVDPQEVLWAVPSPFTSPSVSQGPYLYFSDAQHGWLLVVSAGTMSGHFGPFYRTTDGGLHWKMVSTNPASVAACPNQGPGIGEGSAGSGGISFASASTGIMHGPYCQAGYTTSGVNATYDPSKAPDQRPRQFITHDGGLTWEVQILPAATCCGLSLPVFFDQRHGMAFVGSLPGLLVTSDGGDTWSLQTLPRSAFGDAMPVDAVSFINPNEGWAIVTDWQSRTYSRLFHTGNGGTTWTLVNARLASANPPLGPVLTQGNVPAASSLNFVDSRNGFWATGSKLYKTTDGGHSWTDVQARVG